MDYHVYYEKAHKANDLLEAGDHMGAIAIFEELIASDISNLDKANMCQNIAVCCNKLGFTDQALAWYDEGIRYEAPLLRGLILEYKAAFLAEKRRDAEAIAIYEQLYSAPYVMEVDKERIWKNLTILRNPRP